MCPPDGCRTVTGPQGKLDVRDIRVDVRACEERASSQRQALPAQGGAGAGAGVGRR